MKFERAVVPLATAVVLVGSWVWGHTVIYSQNDPLPCLWFKRKDLMIIVKNINVWKKCNYVTFVQKHKHSVISFAQTQSD